MNNDNYSCRCEHSHHHHHHHQGSIKHKTAKIAAGVVLLIIAAAVEHNCDLPLWDVLLLYLLPYFVVGFGTVKAAVQNLFHGHLFDENFLMTMATVGAFSIAFFPEGEAEFPEAVFVMLFYQVGTLFEEIAERRSCRAISRVTEQDCTEVHHGEADNESQTERFITRFARIYTPIVVGCSVLVALLPPLVCHAATFHDWIYRGLTCLVVSCPCALVISVPLAFFGGLGRVSREGALVKRCSDLERLALLPNTCVDEATAMVVTALGEDAQQKTLLAMRIARKSMRIARQNVSGSIGVKLVIMVLAVMGYTPLWLAVFGDVGVLILAVLNSMRTFVK